MSRSGWFDTLSPAFATVLVMVAAGIGLLGVKMSPVIPAVSDARAVDGAVLPQAILGLPLLAWAVGSAVAAAVDRRLLGVVAAGGGVALAGGLLAAVAAGVLGLEVGVWCVRLAFTGLLVAHVAAVASIAATLGVGRWAGAAGLLLATPAIAALFLKSMRPVVPVLAGSDGMLSRLLVASVPVGLWGLLWLQGLAAVRRRPEYGGRILRGAVRLRCPRCGCEQRQDGAEGCRRCGLDVRIESA
ncbi:MAG: hypothetical protein ACYTEV_00300 [Planctomycetota bacterium]|jgi:hypothetical protein